MAQSATILYRFGDDKVDVLSPIWKGVIKYKKIKQLFENDIRFYIMNEKNICVDDYAVDDGVIIDKETYEGILKLLEKKDGISEDN